MDEPKTPGVSVSDRSAFGIPVVTCAMSVPAFVGYTEKAEARGKSLAATPWRINSLAEFHEAFGAGPAASFTLTAATPALRGTVTLLGSDYALKPSAGRFLLYSSLRLFFENGGGPCYVVPVGDYSTAVDPAKLMQGIDLLVNEREPALLVVPDAVLLPPDDCSAVQRHMLEHCGNVMKNRVALLDLHNGFLSPEDPAGDPVAAFRTGIGDGPLSYGAAYYPWINTTITSETALSYVNLDTAGRGTLQAVLKKELLTDGHSDEERQTRQDLIDALTDSTPDAARHARLLALSPSYKELLRQMAGQLNLLPPSAALAGLCGLQERSRGVWVAPANMSLNAVVSPAVTIDAADQETLQLSPDGKSVNAIRTFVGEGVLVWGARTLDGNSINWRYVNVRRTAIMLEESMRLAAQHYAFEPNVSETWQDLKGAIQDFLTHIWKQGGLAGATANDAFRVSLGPGETMTPEDILDGILRIRVLVSLMRPQEFTEISFEQKMQPG